MNHKLPRLSGALRMIGMKIILLIVISSVCNCAPSQNSAPVVSNQDAMQEATNSPIPYNFEFDSRDKNGTTMFRKESKDPNGKVEGRYGFKDMYGIERIVEYIADKDGYRAKIRTNEPGIERRNSASVEFYTESSNQNAQIAKKQGENMAAVGYKPEATAEEMKNLIAEKVDAAIANQYIHPTEIRSQHHLFPRKQNDLLRLNQNAPLNSAQFEQPKEIPSTPSIENNSIAQPRHYAQQIPTTTDNRRQVEILNAQGSPIQYVSPQQQFIPSHHQLVAIPYNHYYIPQNQQAVALQNGALPSTTQVQTYASQVIQPQPFYSLASHQQPQQGSLVAVPLNYAQAPSNTAENVQSMSYTESSSKGTEYTPLGNRIPGLSEYFQ